ncbi:MAG: terminase small subunit [Sulfuritalea sp.]|nr:terminase small subunit [Sulfuritalea sp.]
MKTKDEKNSDQIGDPIPSTSEVDDPAIAARLAPLLARIKEERRRRFVLAYLRHGNGAQAAREAGYAAQHSRSSAYKLMHDPEVLAVVTEARAVMIEKTGYGIESAMAELDDLMKFSRQTKNANALAKAVELRMKIHGLLDDKQGGQQSPFSIAIHLGDDKPVGPDPWAMHLAPVFPVLASEIAADVIPAERGKHESESPDAGCYTFGDAFPELKRERRQ